MKQYRLQILAACAITVAFYFILGWAGDIDFCDQVILSMSQEEYDYVKDTLARTKNSNPSEREIAHWWADHDYSMQ